MRYPVNAPKPLFPRLSHFHDKWSQLRKTSLSKITVSAMLVLLSLSIATIINYQRSRKKEIESIESRTAMLLERANDPLQVQAPFRSPFRKDD